MSGSSRGDPAPPLCRPPGLLLTVSTVQYLLYSIGRASRAGAGRAPWRRCIGYDCMYTVCTVHTTVFCCWGRRGGQGGRWKRGKEWTGESSDRVAFMDTVGSVRPCREGAPPPTKPCEGGPPQTFAPFCFSLCRRSPPHSARPPVSGGCGGGRAGRPHSRVASGGACTPIRHTGFRGGGAAAWAGGCALQRGRSGGGPALLNKTIAHQQIEKTDKKTEEQISGPTRAQWAARGVARSAHSCAPAHSGARRKTNHPHKTAHAN